MLETLIHEATEPAIGSVIWLHGLAASGNDFAPIAPHMQLPDVRFIFPHAPVRPVTINGGWEDRAWYDITTLNDSPHRETVAHIEESAVLIEALIQREIDSGIPAQNIALLGFSQGAAMALHVGHRFSHTLLGVVVMSGYLLCPERFALECASANVDTPFRFFHGIRDLVVREDKGYAAYEACRAIHHNTLWRDYPVGHEVCLEELREIRAWLFDCFTKRRD